MLPQVWDRIASDRPNTARSLGNMPKRLPSKWVGWKHASWPYTAPTDRVLFRETIKASPPLAVLHTCHAIDSIDADFSS